MLSLLRSTPSQSAPKSAFSLHSLHAGLDQWLGRDAILKPMSPSRCLRARATRSWFGAILVPRYIQGFVRSSLLQNRKSIKQRRRASLLIMQSIEHSLDHESIDRFIILRMKQRESINQANKKRFTLDLSICAPWLRCSLGFRYVQDSKPLRDAATGWLQFSSGRSAEINTRHGTCCRMSPAQQNFST